jgi:hypothetical protein
MQQLAAAARLTVNVGFPREGRVNVVEFEAATGSGRS